jgi:hypothetical protein
VEVDRPILLQCQIEHGRQAARGPAIIDFRLSFYKCNVLVVIPSSALLSRHLQILRYGASNAHNAPALRQIASVAKELEIGQIIRSAISESNNVVDVFRCTQLGSDIHTAPCAKSPIPGNNCIHGPRRPAIQTFYPLLRWPFPIGAAVESDLNQRFAYVLTKLTIMEHAFSIVLRVPAWERVSAS